MTLIDRRRATLLGLLAVALVVAALGLGAGSPAPLAPATPAAVVHGDQDRPGADRVRLPGIWQIR
jgi:hypothetical protein